MLKASVSYFEKKDFFGCPSFAAVCIKICKSYWAVLNLKNFPFPFELLYILYINYIYILYTLYIIYIIYILYYIYYILYIIYIYTPFSLKHSTIHRFNGRTWEITASPARPPAILSPGSRRVFFELGIVGILILWHVYVMLAGKWMIDNVEWGEWCQWGSVYLTKSVAVLVSLLLACC